MMLHMNTPTRRLIDMALTARGHDPLDVIVSGLRADGKSWRYVADIVAWKSGEAVTDVTLINWFGSDDKTAA